MSFVRQRFQIVAFLSILVCLVALVLFLLSRQTATSPGPMPDALASPAPKEIEATPEPTIVEEPAVEVEARVQATQEPEPAEPLCLEGVCTISLNLPAPLGIPIHFVDESANQDWTVPSAECLTALSTFISREEMVWSEITLTLRDELIGDGTPIEFQYPLPEDPVNDPAPDAAVGKCMVESGSRSEVGCQVQILWSSELPNPNLDIAFITASLDALRRVHHEEFLSELENFYHFGEMELFAPAVQARGDGWQSQCLQIVESAVAGVP